MRLATSGHAGTEAPMREQEPSLQEYGEFLLKARLVKEKAAPYCVTMTIGTINGVFAPG